MAFTISGTNGLTFPDSTSMTTGQQACKAWVNFNGTVNPSTIRASFNVGSVTYNGTGDYTVNFTTALADANYSAQINPTNDSSSLDWSAPNGYTYAAGSYRFQTRSSASGSIKQNTYVMCAFFR